MLTDLAVVTRCERGVAAAPPRRIAMIAAKGADPWLSFDPGWPTVVVFDYAERSTSVAIEHPTGGRVRLAVLRRLLDREEQRWLAMLNDHGLADLHRDVARQAVALATLTAAQPAETYTLLGAVPALADSAALRDKVVRWLADLLGGSVEPLKPDVIVEELLETTPDLALLVSNVFARVRDSTIAQPSQILDRMLHSLMIAAERRRHVFLNPGT